MRTLSRTLQTLALLLFWPLAFAYGLARFVAAALLLVGGQLVDIWTNN